MSNWQLAVGSAEIAAANTNPPKSLETEPRFPGEDGGQSLANMAQRDLDAALQLLAERAQYITGASGAAIALRRGEHADMLCRASAGSNAPELGALLSTEYGLSGESVRTRQALRCDDTETDPRVNREGCRQLGIASVVVMPIVSEQRVLGVFELFSGKPCAFQERDLSALQRLGEMVETAVKHAEAAQSLSAVAEPVGAEGQQSDLTVAEALPVESGAAISAELATVASERDAPPLQPEETALEKAELEKAEPETAPKKPLFWSAALQSQPSVGRAAAAAESIPVPLELRNLQKCKACGFPVSPGRTFCVECEEKQWRDQRLPKPAANASPANLHSQQEPQVIRTTGVAPEISVLKASSSAGTSAAQSSNTTVEPAAGELAIAAPVVDDLPQSIPQSVSEDVSGSDNSALFSSSGAPSEAWFAANKYVLGALMVVAIVIGVIAWLR
jgi:GAF domain-containing protein